MRVAASLDLTDMLKHAREAAQQHDGGERSFTLAQQPEILRQFRYEAPDAAYQRLLWDASSPASPNDTRPACYSAGWFISELDRGKPCNPVLIAHSLKAAIWLMREMLPENTLDATAWDALVLGACRLACDYGDGDDDDNEAEGIPNSAQGDSSSAKRCADEAGMPHPKRARGASVATDASPQSGSDECSGAEEPQHVAVRTTNNTRQAERRREARLEKIAQQRKERVGLPRPVASAERVEKAAYEAICPDDEADIAWIIKQCVSNDTDFYSSARTPYLTASTMLEKARVVGSSTARTYAATFLSDWRATGTPFQLRPPTQVARLLGSPEGDTLENAWLLAHYASNACNSMMIQYRWSMARLGEAYTMKLASIEQEDAESGVRSGRSRGGKGNARTEAINSITERLGQLAQGIERPAIRKRLQRAMRWYNVASELGWGFLTLIPHESVSNYWIEQTLRAGEWQLWLGVVKKVNPDIRTASQALDAWLGAEGLAGGPIGDKQPLFIEYPSRVGIVEEIADTDDERDPLIESSPGNFSTQVSNGPLREAPLLELFMPLAQRHGSA